MIGVTKYWQNLNWFSLLLFPLSLVYCLLTIIRKFCYQFQCFKSSTFQVPVIIVGNISVGGNGKTPLIIYLVEEFKRKGYKPGVVSRGYGAKNPQLQLGKVLAVDISDDAAKFGDEPWMIAKKTNCPVVVGRKRDQAVKYLVKEFDCNMVLSDDGLQHYAMNRDIEICVIDSSKQFGNGLCLPAGPLREPVSRLKEVDFIVHHLTTAEKNSDREIQMQLEFDQIYSLDHIKSVDGFFTAEGSLPAEGSLLAEGSKEKLTISEFKNKTVHAVAGIANPQRFFDQLRRHGVNVIEHPFADHHHFLQTDVQFTDDIPVLMTEKDAVKCCSYDLGNCWYIPVKAALSMDLVGSIIEKLKVKS